MQMPGFSPNSKVSHISWFAPESNPNSTHCLNVDTWWIHTCGRSRVFTKPEITEKRCKSTVYLMTWLEGGWLANKPAFVFCIVLGRWPPGLYNCASFNASRWNLHEQFNMTCSHCYWEVVMTTKFDWVGVYIVFNRMTHCSSLVKVINTKSGEK